MTAKHSPLRFDLMEVGYWCAYGAFTTFCVSYVLELGMSASGVGFMAAVYMLCAFLGQFFWGALCDRTGAHRPLFALGCALLFLAFCLFFAHPLGPLGLLLYGAVGFIQQPVGALLDTWVMRSCRAEPHRFGRARACSTFAYALLMPLQGNLIRALGYGCMVAGAGLFLLLSLLVCLLTADAPAVARSAVARPAVARPAVARPAVARPAGQERPSLRRSTRALGPLALVLLLLFCMGVANAPQIQLTALLVAGVGGTVVHQSYVMFANSIAQSPVLMLSRRLFRVSAPRRLCAASALFVLTLLCIAAARTPAQLTCCYLLNGLGSALYLPAMRQMMLELAPANLQATAQGLGDATYQSLAGMCSTALSGVVVERLGVRCMVLLCLAVQAFSLCLLLAYCARGARRVPQGRAEGL